MKSWQQKFDNGKPPQLKVLEKSFAGFPPGTVMYISSPAEIDQYMQN